MYGTAEFANGVQQAILIPRSAVVHVARYPVCMFSMDKGSRNFATLPWSGTGDRIEVLSACLPVKNSLTHLRSRLAGKRIEVQHDARPWNSRAAGAFIS